jgi:hypothetical protein
VTILPRSSLFYRIEAMQALRGSFLVLLERLQIFHCHSQASEKYQSVREARKEVLRSARQLAEALADVAESGL